MTEPSPTPLAWVSKRDGRLVPFDADKISRALFAATETVGRPDAFTARELTDSIVHFLAAEADNSTLTSAQVSELVVKVVRELGQPALSQAFEEFARQRLRTRQQSPPSAAPVEKASAEPPSLDVQAAVFDPQTLAWRTSGTCLRDYSLRAVFTRDLVAAQADGLLTLTGLEAPFELAGCVLGPPSRLPLVETVEQARRLAGSFLAVDGPEYALASRTSDAETATYARELSIGLRATGLRALVNLNTASPPLWADDLADGPLFAPYQQPRSPERLAALAEDLREQLLPAGPAPGLVRIDWHLAERDFAPAAAATLTRLARRALEGAALAFAFDRPRRPVPLAEGLDRRHPAVLLAVGLHLPRLLQQLRPRAEPAQLLPKLESLARMALSAAVQKRDFLRRHDRSRPAFLLDRARLVVIPVGLEATVRTLLGAGLCAPGPGLDFARQIVQRLRDVLHHDGQASHLDARLDSAADFTVDDGSAAPAEPSRAAGLTSWDPTATPRSQLKAAGPLHALAEAGTVAVLVPDDRPPTAEEVVELLRHAWQGQVTRLRFLRLTQPQPQLTAPWEPAAKV